MKIVLMLALLALVFWLGRMSQRNRLRLDRHITLTQLLWSIVGLLLALNSSGLTAYVISQNSTLTEQNECRADLAAPVNDATADATVGLARGLVLLNDDPSVHRQLVQRFGPDLPAALRAQAKTILDASDRLEVANANRTPDPVGQCK